MSKLTKTLKSASKQLRIENVLGVATATAASALPKAAVKCKSETALLDDSSLAAAAVEAEAPPKKKMFMSEAEASGSESDSAPITSKAAQQQLLHPLGKDKVEHTSPLTSLIEEIRKKRVSMYESVAVFRFNKKRVRVLSEATQIPDNSKGLVYWMSRDQRVQGNSNTKKQKHKALYSILFLSKITGPSCMLKN